ncbi:Cyclin C-terminal domain [Trinorchestia longiramus]|nr:Cyclin C-terminal domain [Trinorchestia longiramus]
MYVKHADDLAYLTHCKKNRHLMLKSGFCDGFCCVDIAYENSAVASSGISYWCDYLCEHRSCEDQVFLTAVNLLDRFLDVTPIQRSQLQLTACACLLLASKIRQCTYLSVDTLAYYTEDSVTVEEIRQWEVLILAKLAWNVCPVIPFDFVEPLLNLIPKDENFERIRSHSYTYVTLAATDSAFVGTPSSCVAAAAVLSAIEGVSPTGPHSLSPTMEQISSALHCPVSDITPTKERLDTVIQNYLQQLNNMNNNTANSTPPHPFHHIPSTTSLPPHPSYSFHHIHHIPSTTSTKSTISTTPTPLYSSYRRYPLNPPYPLHHIHHIYHTYATMTTTSTPPYPPYTPHILHHTHSTISTISTISTTHTPPHPLHHPVPRSSLLIYL